MTFPLKRRAAQAPLTFSSKNKKPFKENSSLYFLFALKEFLKELLPPSSKHSSKSEDSFKRTCSKIFAKTRLYFFTGKNLSLETNLHLLMPHPLNCFYSFLGLLFPGHKNQ